MPCSYYADILCVQHLNSARYRGPCYAASVVNRYCSSKDIYILDVAAGTGLVGAEVTLQPEYLTYRLIHLNVKHTSAIMNIFLSTLNM